MQWIKISEQLPEEGQLCWIRRSYNGHTSLYIGHRAKGEFSTNPDASKNTHWYGSHIHDMYRCRFWEMKFTANFSDVTVGEWCPVTPPNK